MGNKSKRLEKELESLCISLEKFLVYYCGINYELIKGIKINHKDVKKIIPSLETVKFELVAKNKNRVYNGNIIIVKDSYGQIAPYINPGFQLEDNTLLCDEECNENIFNIKENIFKDIIISENLSLYELLSLSKYYKKNKNLARYRAVRKLIVEKNDKTKVYKNKKLNLKMEGKEYYEEY